MADYRHLSHARYPERNFQDWIDALGRKTSKVVIQAREAIFILEIL